jgi:hypothetical protein
LFGEESGLRDVNLAGGGGWCWREWCLGCDGGCVPLLLFPDAGGGAPHLSCPRDLRMEVETMLVEGIAWLGWMRGTGHEWKELGAWMWTFPLCLNGVGETAGLD